MLYLKACPRCHGDIKVNKDIYGTYKECLQCGYMLDVAESELKVKFAGEQEVARRGRKVA